MLTPLLTSDRLLLHEGVAESAVERKLATAEGAAAILRMLATELLTAEIDVPWRWLREIGAASFTRLCQTKDAATLPALTLEEREALITAAPPFAGAEYLTSEVIDVWWNDLRAYITAIASQHGGIEPWLREECPAWHVVGRVSFHLAENKADTQRPFAFLATFTEKLSATGQPQHLPLARALQLYAGQKDQTALNALLEPVRTAAAKSKLLREWVETKRLFQPMAM